MPLARTVPHSLRLAGALRGLSARRFQTAIAVAAARLPQAAAASHRSAAGAPRSTRTYAAAPAGHPTPPPSPPSSQQETTRQYSFEEVRKPSLARLPSSPTPLTHRALAQIHALTTQPPRGDNGDGAAAAEGTTAAAPALLIDVREPAEYAAGHIPGARNVPVSTAPEALHLPAEEFEERFGFAKPGAGAGSGGDVVFYCKAGVRSRAAAGMAVMAGWRGVGEYKGSWAEWSRRGGRSER